MPKKIHHTLYFSLDMIHLVVYHITNKTNSHFSTGLISYSVLTQNDAPKARDRASADRGEGKPSSRPSHDPKGERQIVKRACGIEAGVLW